MSKNYLQKVIRPILKDLALDILNKKPNDPLEDLLNKVHELNNTKNNMNFNSKDEKQQQNKSKDRYTLLCCELNKLKKDFEQFEASDYEDDNNKKKRICEKRSKSTAVICNKIEVKERISLAPQYYPNDDKEQMRRHMSERVPVKEIDSVLKKMSMLKPEISIFNDETYDNESESDSSGQDDIMDANELNKLENIIASRKSRSGISSSVLMKEDYSGYVTVINKKTQEVKDALKKQLIKSILFQKLPSEDFEMLIDSLESIKYAQNITIIKEGDDGQTLQVVFSGELKCTKFIEGENKFLKNQTAGGVFGELALLYNAPRAASITTTTECQLQSLNRDCFNYIVKDSAKRRNMSVLKFISEVEIFKALTQNEKIKLCDAFIQYEFEDEEHIMNQGDKFDNFQIVEKGKAYALIDDTEVMQQKRGDQFGELSLLTNSVRSAAIVANGKLVLMGLDRDSFDRLLGNIVDILKGRTKCYAEAVNELCDNI